MGYKVVEFNASDVRNAKGLKAQVSELVNSTSLTQFWGSKKVHARVQTHTRAHICTHTQTHTH